MPNPPHRGVRMGMWAVSCLFPQRCCCTWEPCSDPFAQKYADGVGGNGNATVIGQLRATVCFMPRP